MARLGNIHRLPKPVDVAVQYRLDEAAQACRWSICSLDVYESESGDRPDDRTLYTSHDAAAIDDFLEDGGYVRAGNARQYRLYDDTCGRCGVYVPPPDQSRHVEGWHGGREYRRFGGRLQVLRVRCPAHPFDVEAEARALGSAGLL